MLPDLMTDNVGFVPELSATSDAPVIVAEPPTAEPAAEPPPAEPVGAAPEPTAEPVEPKEPEALPPPKQRGFGERLSELTAARRAAEQRADRLEASLEKAVDALNRSTQQQTQPKTEAEPVAEPRPQREQYEDPDTYDAALMEWATRQGTKLAAAELEKRSAEQRAADEEARRAEENKRQQEEISRSWTEKKEALADNPDYADWEEVATNPELEIAATMVPAIVNADNGPQVLYHLGKNPDEAARISKLDPMRQVMEIGRISERLARPATPAPRRLPAPIEPVGGRNPSRDKTPDEMSMDEYAAKRLPEVRSTWKTSMFGRA